MSVRRQPPGIPSGGQFAPGSRSRAHLSLVPDSSEHLEAEAEDTPDPVTDASPEPTQPSGAEDSPNEPQTSVSDDGQYTTVTGSKYTGYRSVSEIAKDVRKDIKAAIAAGELPSEFRYSVTSEKYSMGQSMNITVRGMNYDEIHGLLKPNGKRSRRYTQATRDMLNKLEGFGKAYDKATSDPMTDYHHGNHFTFTSVETPASAAWDRMDRARNEYKKVNAEASRELRMISVRCKIPMTELAKVDVTVDERTKGLDPQEQMAVLVAQEKLRGARAEFDQAKAHYEMLRKSEEDFDDSE